MLLPYLSRASGLCFMVVFFAMLFAVASVGASNTYREVSAPEVKQLLDERGAVIVNNLSSLEFELQHIPGSLSIPINLLEESDLLPEDKNTPLIFYCINER